MPSKIIEYALAEDGSAAELEKTVNMLIEADYEPWGSPVITMYPDGFHTFFQALVKRAEVSS